MGFMGEREAGMGMGSPTTAMSFEDDAARVFGNLQRAVADVLKAMPVQVRKAGDLERGLGLDRKLSWQVHRMATAESPAAAGTSVPTRASVNRFLKAAARRRTPAIAIERVTCALDEFDRFVERHAGDRSTLDAMLSAYVSDARPKQELVGKAALFRGISQIKGLAIEHHIDAGIMQPSPDGRRIDGVSIVGDLGLRRVHPAASFCSSVIVVGGAEQPRLSLAGEKLIGPNDAVLAEFSSSPTPEFESIEYDGPGWHFIPGRDMGLRSAIDVIRADYLPGVKSRYRGPHDHPVSQLFARIENPEKRLTKDVFVHRDLFPGADAQLAIHETLTRGLVTKFDDPMRVKDRMRMLETIESIPGGLLHAKLSDFPRYTELLEYACRKRGWDATAFRGFRLDVQYPVYGAQYSIGFDLPDQPST